DALGDVDFVIEVDVVRKISHPMPGDRGVVRQALPHRRQHGGVGPYLRMAGHAGIGWRQPGVGGGFNRSVAEAAVDPEAGDVMLMTERHRLLHGPTPMPHVVHPRPRPPPHDAPRDKRGQPDDANLRRDIRRWPEDGCHRDAFSEWKLRNAVPTAASLPGSPASVNVMKAIPTRRGRSPGPSPSFRPIVSR